jgi:hypothetical protein
VGCGVALENGAAGFTGNSTVKNILTMSRRRRRAWVEDWPAAWRSAMWDVGFDGGAGDGQGCRRPAGDISRSWDLLFM